MKVAELIELLSSMDPKSEVILQKDAEGNGYSPLQGADDNAVYAPETTYSGEVYNLGYGAEENGFEESEWKKTFEETPLRCTVSNQLT